MGQLELHTSLQSLHGPDTMSTMTNDGCDCTSEEGLGLPRRIQNWSRVDVVLMESEDDVHIPFLDWHDAAVAAMNTPCQMTNLQLRFALYRRTSVKFNRGVNNCQRLPRCVKMRIRQLYTEEGGFRQS